MTRLPGLAAVVVASVALSACGMAQSESMPEPGTASSVTHSVQGLETASGTFEGARGHMTSGTASIFRVDGQWVVSLGSDFSFDGAPTPMWRWGTTVTEPMRHSASWPAIRGRRLTRFRPLSTLPTSMKSGSGVGSFQSRSAVQS